MRHKGSVRESYEWLAAGRTFTKPKQVPSALLIAALEREEVQDDLRSRFTPDENGCWIWKTGKMGYYALFGVLFPVHRLFWMGEHGTPIPEDSEIIRTCFNPACVNPGHLSCLARSQPRERRKNRTRNLHIPKWKTILFDEQVKMMREDRDKGPGYWEKFYNVTYQTAFDALHGRTFKHIIDPPPWPEAYDQ